MRGLATRRRSPRLWPRPHRGRPARSAAGSLSRSLWRGSLGDLEEGPKARGGKIGIGGFDRPLAGVVGNEGDMRLLARRNQDIVAPIGLPAIVQRVQQTPDVAA